MAFKLEYDSGVMRPNPATVAALALTLCFLPGLVSAQVHGTSPSVTSTNFGGHVTSASGIPASVTSLGPRGTQQRIPFLTQPCCISQLPANPNRPGNGRRRHHHGEFFPGGGSVYVPYAYPVVGEFDAGDAYGDQQENQQQSPEEYRGGPTIFDRRGSGTPAPLSDPGSEAHRNDPTRSEAEAAPAAPPQETVADLPRTLLVFKDGHQAEVENYAVIGDTLYDLTPGRHHKIPLGDLDLTSTAKQNDDRGIDFRLPPQPEAKK